MHFLPLFALANLILAAPANVLVVTKVKTVTVISGPEGLTTIAIEGEATQTQAATDAVEPATQAVTSPTAVAYQADEPEQEQEKVQTTVPAAPTDLPATTSIATATTSSSSTSTSSTSPTSDSGSGSGSGSKRGEGTYYDTGLGACGITNTDSDFIVAVSHELFDETNTGNPNNNEICGKKIRAYYEGKSVEVEVTDRCEGCKYDDLDFSPAAFKQIADQGLGRIDISWDWV